MGVLMNVTGNNSPSPGFLAGLGQVEVREMPQLPSIRKEK